MKIFVFLKTEESPMWKKPLAWFVTDLTLWVLHHFSTSTWIDYWLADSEMGRTNDIERRMGLQLRCVMCHAFWWPNLDTEKVVLFCPKLGHQKRERAFSYVFGKRKYWFGARKLGVRLFCGEIRYFRRSWNNWPEVLRSREKYQKIGTFHRKAIAFSHH